MSDFWSHRLAAEKALPVQHSLKALSQNSDSVLFRLYLLGAQGPDLFYYINKTNLLSKASYTRTGNLLHSKDIKETFYFMIETALKQDDDRLMAYCFGFLTHYIIDVHCHPLICAWGPDSSQHKVVEMYLEKCTLDDMSPIAIKNLDYKKLLIDPEIVHHLYDALLCKIPQLKDTKLPLPAEIAKVTHEMAFIQKLLTRRTIEKLPFRKVLSKIFHYNLDLILLPQVSPNTAIDYPVYKAAFLKGIEVSNQKLSELENVKLHPETLKDFIDTTFNFDYLGEEIKTYEHTSRKP